MVPGASVDFACFGLDARGKLSDERFCIYSNNAAAPDAGVLLMDGGSDHARFNLTLSQLGPQIHKLVFVASLDGTAEMRQLLMLELRVGPELLSLTGSDFGSERALLLFEIYRRDAEWRYAVPCQGFGGGMATVIRHFGGQVAAA